MNTTSEAGIFMKVINTNADFKCMKREIVPMGSEYVYWKSKQINPFYKYVNDIRNWSLWLAFSNGSRSATHIWTSSLRKYLKLYTIEIVMKPSSTFIMKP
jgi:hypothetical protein